MSNSKSRIVRVNEVMSFTGYKERASYRLMKEIRETLGLREKQLIMVSHFCEYMGINEEEYFKGI